MPLTERSAARKDNATGANAKLQHRHFAFIAATLKENQPRQSNNAEYWQWQTTVIAFERACKRTNPNFDSQRFLNACGMES